MVRLRAPWWVYLLILSFGAFFIFLSYQEFFPLSLGIRFDAGLDGIVVVPTPGGRAAPAGRSAPPRSPAPCDRRTRRRAGPQFPSREPPRCRRGGRGISRRRHLDGTVRRP